MKLRFAAGLMLIVSAALAWPAFAADGPSKKTEQSPAAGKPPKKIRVFRVGSSSFGPDLLENTKRIVDATGQFVLDWEAKGGDSAGYTRLDQFVRQPGLYEEWCKKYLPQIEKGHYDYVIFQTIGWFNFTPEETDKLITKILPDLAAKIRKAGAEVILYDKFVALERSERDPRARAWAGRYPEGIRYNNLLHVMAGKQAGIDKITFGGGTVQELWDQEPFKNMRYLYNDPGHPGPIAHYISACCMSYLMTGIDPSTSKLSLIEFGRAKAFAEEPSKGGKDFYDAYKDRIKGDSFELTKAELKIIHETAMKNHCHWSDVLKAAQTNDAEYANVEAEVRRIQAQTMKLEDYGFSASKAAQIRKEYAEAASEDELTPAAIAKIRDKTTSIHGYGRTCDHFLEPAKRKPAAKELIAYWDKNNSKLRDDVLYECALLVARTEKQGDRDEAARLDQAHAVLHHMVELPGHRIVLREATEEKKKEYLAQFHVSGAPKRYAPQFAAYQTSVKNDPEELLKAWDVYLDVWTDNDLMDKLKEKKFAQEVFLEADKEFAKRIVKK